MDFAFFTLLNIILLLRPEELFPGIAGLRLYLVTITLTTLIAFPKVLPRLSFDYLRFNPIAFCVLGLIVTGFLSLAIRGFRFVEAFDFLGEFTRVVLYFFLFISIIDTPQRLRSFLFSIICITSISTSIAIGDFLGYWDFENIEHVEQWNDAPDATFDPDDAGEEYFQALEEERAQYQDKIRRMVSTGIFNDPNDLGILLVFAMVCTLYLAYSSHDWFIRLLSLAPLSLFFYGILLTGSRGALLSLFAAFGGIFYSWFGLKKAGPIAVGFVVCVLALIGGRQGSIGGGGTTHERIMLWAYGLGDLFREPIYIMTGLGIGHMVKEHLLVCHNSFVQGYVETGILGGGLFCMVYFLAFRLSDLAGRDHPERWAREARPFMMAIVVGYGAGCYSVTRNYVLSSYLALGIATVYTNLAAPIPPYQYQVTREACIKFMGLAILGLVLIKYSTQLLGQAGL